MSPIQKSKISKEKSTGRFYTPDYIVKNILDLSGYYGSKIILKHAIDNSCGDGAFLVEIVDRYCKECKKQNMSIADIKSNLENYIHGIEIDEQEHKKCIENVSSVVQKYGISNVIWDINCADTLTVHKYDGKMDFVLGNPPYIRVHNLGNSFDEIKKFAFSQAGMTDLYIVFYEIGLKMLNSTGVLGYITPSSFFNSVAGKFMRNHFVSHSLIDKIVDLKHFQAFDATTYTTIVILKKCRNTKEIEYYQFDEKNLIPYYVDTLLPDDYLIAGNFYFSSKNSLVELQRILTFRPSVEYFSVKNGFATLADGFFIGDLPFADFTIPVLKASTGKWHKCLFPYRRNKLVPYDELTAVPEIKSYYENNKDTLLKRSLDGNSEWYGFGRTQGINDVWVIKYAINSLVRTAADIKLIKCESGTGIYSGLYIVTNIAENELRELLICDDFIKYVSMLSKYKSGGYYTFSSKDIKQYLEYKYSQRNGFANEQLSIFGNS